MLKKAKNSREKIVRITMLGLLTAFIILFGLTPLGYIPTGLGFNITFLSVPVALGAIILGPSAGAFLGLAFGLTSVYQGISGMDPSGPALFASSPIGATITCIVPRVLMGLLIAIIARSLLRLCKTSGKQILAYGAIAALASALNTVLFLGSFWIFFGGFTFATFLATIFALNALLEIVFAALVTPPIAKAVSILLPRLVRER